MDIVSSIVALFVYVFFNMVFKSSPVLYLFWGSVASSTIGKPFDGVYLTHPDTRRVFHCASLYTRYRKKPTKYLNK